MKKVFLGIGTNLGNRKNNILEAVGRIKELIGPVISASSFYETEPWGFRSENKFLNMVVEVETKLRPSDLLGRLLVIESLFGRVREGKQYSSRIIDLDILLYNNKIMETKVLEIPHPKMHERRFVLVPLVEIAPDIVHPVLKKSIRDLLKECPDKSNVRLQDIRKPGSHDI
jgi:2-amino-4-hydroxy-6-hydroxymethyldihydropteridine diphosphokinase